MQAMSGRCDGTPQPLGETKTSPPVLQHSNKGALRVERCLFCRSGPAPGGQLPSLPLDVLQKVASLMPLKDWARASGACRLMHTLQLDVIEVATLTCEHVGFRQQERSAGAHQHCILVVSPDSMHVRLCSTSKAPLMHVQGCSGRASAGDARGACGLR